MLERSGLTGELPELGTIDFLLMARGRAGCGRGRYSMTALRRAGGSRPPRHPRPLPEPGGDGLALALRRAAGGDAGEPDRARRPGRGGGRAWPAPSAAERAHRSRAADPRRDRRQRRGRRTCGTRSELLDGHLAGGARAGSDRARPRSATRDAEDARARPSTGAWTLPTAPAARRSVERAMEALRDDRRADPRRPRQSGVDSLTPQERRVARTGGGGTGQPRDRRVTLPHPAHGRDAPLQRLSQAGDRARARSCRTRSAPGSSP